MCLSIYLSCSATHYLSIYLSIYPSIHPSIYLCFYLSIYLSIYLTFWFLFLHFFLYSYHYLHISPTNFPAHAKYGVMPDFSGACSYGCGANSVPFNNLCSVSSRKCSPWLSLPLELSLLSVSFIVTRIWYFSRAHCWLWNTQMNLWRPSQTPRLHLCGPTAVRWAGTSEDLVLHRPQDMLHAAIPIVLFWLTS